MILDFAREHDMKIYVWIACNWLTPIFTKTVTQYFGSEQHEK